jgi:dynein heavy chain
MDTLQKYRQYIDNLPIIDDPEIFGMHQNANITFQVNELPFYLNSFKTMILIDF